MLAGVIVKETLAFEEAVFWPSPPLAQRKPSAPRPVAESEPAEGAGALTLNPLKGAESPEATETPDSRMVFATPTVSVVGVSVNAFANVPVVAPVGCCPPPLAGLRRGREG